MSKSIKKLTMLLLAVVMAVAFAACGGTEKSADQDEAAEQSADKTENQVRLRSLRTYL